jgi:hypothetical protein
MSKVYLITAIAEFDEKMVEDEGEELITLLNKAGIFGIEAITPYQPKKYGHMTCEESLLQHKNHLEKTKKQFRKEEEFFKRIDEIGSKKIVSCFLGTSTVS